MGEIYKKAIEQLKEKVKQLLPEIEEDGDWLWHHPETGFKEIGTQNYCLEVIKKHGFEARTWPDITGFTCIYDT